ncbi:Rha family transcriptional regulator [Helicobacter sp. 13S00482-2]|uniref:Rha family transcriptional regulator n=1 Tax=Helicobacter sp. 13S00482-2 TaxID=1476200 RepID=UPI001C5E182A|nr:Rha family transcriptional regulator [Helicobacter sp. 13S00482-2]
MDYLRVSQTTNLDNVKITDQRYKYYNVTKDGFAILVMDFMAKKLTNGKLLI